MSEVDSRPPTRGRTSTRGGRGSIGRGGPRGGRKPSSEPAAQIDEMLNDQGELAEAKKKYGTELPLLKDMFPDWTDVDLLFALQESDGDISKTVDKITQGNVSQFAEVKKAKDRARSKVKEEAPAISTTDKGSLRGRGRGAHDSIRGGRGRASERGRGGLRGGRGGHAVTNGSSKDLAATSVPTAESSAWDTTAALSGNLEVDEAGKSALNPAAAQESAVSQPAPETGAKKSWASMFSQPKPAPAPAVPKAAPATQAPPALEVNSAPNAEQDLASAAPSKVALEQPTSPQTADAQAETKQLEEASILPSNVPLTEANVEHLPDDSHPPQTQTVLSTAGSMDTRNATPLPAQTPIGRPVAGYAATAYRATAVPTRSASFQRRVKEQQEAVVMPGHNAVDRAAVQFGSMGLNGEQGPDVDEDREEPETRQAPQASPPSQPRTSLPPAPRQPGTSHDGTEVSAGSKQAPGLPPASAQNQQQMQDAATGNGASHEHSAMSQNYAQYGRYGQPGMQQDTGSHKAYDPFGHQAQSSPYDQYGVQAQQQAQQSAHSGFGGLSSAPADYSSYYTSDPSRNAYSQYYGSAYGQQDGRGPAGQSQQDSGLASQRGAAGFGAGSTETGLSQQQQSQQAQQQPQNAQSRFGESPGSGQNTPNPGAGAQQSSGPAHQQGQQSLHSGPNHQQQQAAYGAAAAAGYPYGHPYYNSPYQQAYQNQFGYPNGPSGYNAGYPSKGAYGVPHGYGMGSQTSYDQHSSSPAAAGGYGQTQSMRNASGMSTALGGGLDEYSRGSAQPGNQQQGGGFGGMTDPFARSASGFGGQGGYGGQQSGATNPDDSLKSFNDPKSGPSPALGQPGRPGSAANSAVGNAQAALPPPQSQQGGFSGYPGFPSQGSQYGGLGGLGSHQQVHQNNMGAQGGYGGYAAGGFNQTYGGYGSRGGWGSNYGTH